MRLGGRRLRLTCERRGSSGVPGEAVYNASKSGQVGFTQALDHELLEHGVRATSICPGGVRTEFAIGSGREHGDPEHDAMLSPEEVADVVMFTVTRPRMMRMLTQHLSDAQARGPGARSGPTAEQKMPRAPRR